MDWATLLLVAEFLAAYEKNVWFVQPQTLLPRYWLSSVFVVILTFSSCPKSLYRPAAAIAPESYSSCSHPRCFRNAHSDKSCRIVQLSYVRRSQRFASFPFAVTLGNTLYYQFCLCMLNEWYDCVMKSRGSKHHQTLWDSRPWRVTFAEDWHSSLAQALPLTLNSRLYFSALIPASIISPRQYENTCAVLFCFIVPSCLIA